MGQDYVLQVAGHSEGKIRLHLTILTKKTQVDTGGLNILILFTFLHISYNAFFCSIVIVTSIENVIKKYNILMFNLKNI